MANQDNREALRGAEEETFDALAEVLTSQQWGELLKAPLERAAAKGDRVLTQKLVGAGAEMGEALHEAVLGDHEGIVNDLLENGASIDGKDTSRDGSTPLHIAARKGKTEMVQLLLLKGADIDALDRSKWTSLYTAAIYCRVAVERALLDAGADISVLCGEYKTPVMHVIASQPGHVEVLRRAIELGADVNATDADGRTALHGAASDNKVEAIEVLLGTGANIEARDTYGSTPLHLAADECSLEAVPALFEHGADVEAKDIFHGTPIHHAASRGGVRGATAVVDALLRSGADETILNDEGKAATDVVGRWDDAEGDDREDVELVRGLLANAPADRAWRRRGYLVLCRAHLGRVQLMQESISAPTGVMGRRTRSGAKLAKTEAHGCTGAVVTSMVDGRDDWAFVVARVLGLQEEGIFRMIVGHL